MKINENYLEEQNVKVTEDNMPTFENNESIKNLA